jgi:DNA recombination protein RmuC
MPTLFNILIIFGGLLLVYILLKKDIEKLISQSKDFDLQNQILNPLLQITEKIAKLEKISEDIKSGSDKIQSIKEILSGPKNRGYFGEITLKEILRKNLPSSMYKEQYLIGSYRVDYVLKFDNKIIPIDSKFSLQELNNVLSPEEKNKESLKRELIRTLKSQIESIAQKYISPEKGTTEFALMYLANEGIYYELLSDKIYDDIWDFARQKSVFITSPKTFEIICSYLGLIVRKQELAKHVQQIYVDLIQLEKDLPELKQRFETSYKQLNYSFDNFREFEKKLNKFISDYQSLLNIVKSEEKLEQKIKERSLI